MRKSIIVLFLCLAVQQLSAQRIRLGDMGFFSIDKPYPENLKRFAPIVGFDAQNIFIGSKSVRIAGLRLGVLDRNLHLKAGFLFSAINNRLKSYNQYVPQINDYTFIESNYSIMAFFIEPILFENKRFLVTSPVNLGYGLVEQYYGTEVGSLKYYRKFPMGLFSVQATGQVKLFYWLGLGAGIGYHFSGGSDDEIRNEYSGLMFNIRLKIDFFGIYKTVTHYLEKNPK
jgi:hypothetical protein